ncbi:M48 family metalloprotease [Microbaculum sp. FT89]|uniref:M48 family metalloprotease n=1 Tax=Microbaculum sp. FT89 TaxID=3447298 RepID=UPI003F53A3BD
MSTRAKSLTWPKSAWRKAPAAAMLLAALALAGCANGGLSLGDGGSLSAAAIQPVQSNAGFDEKEVALGKREHPKIVTAFGGTYADPQLQRYLNATVEKLSRASDRPDLGYTVTVLNSPSINAFSLPGGYVYVTRGLLALANDSSEVANVLAHEMAHVIARHAIQREEQANSVAVMSQVVNDVIRDPEAGQAALALTKGRLAQFSRQQELDADVIGIRMAAKAGYDPEGAVAFLRALERQTDLHSKVLNQVYDAGRVDLFASHPATPQRILSAEREATQVGRNADMERDQASYFQVIDGMAYGDDPREGFVSGRTFIHPALGITFTLPEGYGLENTPRAVVGFSENGDIIRFDAVAVPSTVSLSDYLAADAVRGGRVTDIKPMTVNGLPAATATVGGEGWTFKVAAIRGDGNRVYRFILASRDLDYAREQELLAAARSFRVIPQEEARSIRPQRLDIVAVRPGDSIESVASRMAFDDHQIERFRVLNGLSPADRLRAGQEVKIVVR